jgi:hypothetical protein
MKTIFEEDGGLLFKLKENLSIWDNFEKIGTPQFDYPTVDVALDPRIEYSEIPQLIEFLKTVYKIRVIQNNRERRIQDWELESNNEN